MESKQAMLAELREEFNRWEELLGSLSEEQIIAPDMPSNLSIKDVIAHLHAWQELSIAKLEAALHNKELKFQLGPAGSDPDSEADLERINAWIHERNRSRSWPDVYRDWRDGFLRLLELGEAVPEEDLLEVGKYAWLNDYSLLTVLRGSWEHHHEEHLGPLLAWMRENGQ